MKKILQEIIEKARNLSFTYGIKNMSIDDMCNKLGISKKTFYKYFKNKTDLVEKVLEFERERFKSIFVEYDFEGVNAIDILLTVSKEIALRFKDVTPSLTFELKKYYPELYQKHFEARIDFIFEKIKINLTKGINQGIYRDDLSIELIARLYISRLIDIHDPEFFPPEKYSFEIFFDVMFENFIRGIAKPEGIKYYEKQFEKQKKLLKAKK
ncbi:MAG: TetR/AcrR family transcriptional regulator [Bacteroidales bacterium]|nr:TetR/AcrR family transcriptional regulator [Bacteroidales bacterium]